MDKDILLQKYMFIDNCLKCGWSIKMKNSKYILFKKHHSKKKYVKNEYLLRFMEEMIEK
jgi:hypothetical protein